MKKTLIAMALAAIMSSATAQVKSVEVNGENRKDVFKVIALYNGGPGLYWYYIKGSRDLFFLDPFTQEIANAYRFARSIKLNYAE
jgi:opacity protein-like surface antigen